MTVMKNPDGSRPGVSILASMPTTNPMSMVQINPIAVLLRIFFGDPVPLDDSELHYQENRMTSNAG